ncbi:MAG: hypothetical protein QOD69_973 [Solirubrobacteraceae bacterium]|jgi:hypothetical protein|nr:hypothetical protein [Solirubrobacteraceae bacterium]
MAVDVLPETAAVHWRARIDAARLRRSGKLWTLATVGHVVPFAGAAAGLMLLNPLALPVALVCLAHAWVIPELYAQRGANVLRPRRRAAAAPERRSVGLLGDLVGDEARELHAQTGLVLEPGRLGTWLVGEAGAVLLHGRRRRAYCYCVRVNPEAVAEATDSGELPSGDRIAHLLLALRADEQGFATVANLAFAGARWRLRRRLAAPLRPALDRAAAIDRRSSAPT